jgi:hypothetical protein
MRTTWLVFLSSMFVVFGAAGCVGAEGPTDCTEAFCSSGITVEVEHLAELVRSDSEATAVALCRGTTCATFHLRQQNTGIACELASGNAEADRCTVDADGKVKLILGIVAESPTELELTVKSTGAEIKKTVMGVTDKTLAPNGLDCPPICHQGSTTVSL